MCIRDRYEQTLALGDAWLTADTNALEQVVRFFYNRAKDAGEQVPTNVMEWARQDIGQIGAWEYRVLDLETNDPESLEKQLNALGAARWECFSVEDTPTGKRLYLKKAGRSYLRTIPTGDLLKLIPATFTKE